MKRRRGERRRFPYVCQACGHEGLQIRGSLDVGTRIFTCPECRQMDWQRFPGDRRAPVPPATRQAEALELGRWARARFFVGAGAIVAGAVGFVVGFVAGDPELILAGGIAVPVGFAIAYHELVRWSR